MNSQIPEIQIKQCPGTHKRVELGANSIAKCRFCGATVQTRRDQIKADDQVMWYETALPHSRATRLLQEAERLRTLLLKADEEYESITSSHLDGLADAFAVCADQAEAVLKCCCGATHIGGWTGQGIHHTANLCARVAKGHANG